TSVLFLVPGVPLINSIMDILEGHVLAGISRMVNATILIICLSIGFLITLLMLGIEKL
ncbi:MAG: threonine/serine exporter family protein, partial [Tannerellaceae bacterium]